MRITDFNYLTQYDGFPDQKVLLVGMLEDGPVGRAFSMDNPDKVSLYLGDNETTNAYHHLFSSGVPSQNIFFYRLNGQISQVIVDDLDENPLLELRALTGHEYDNNIEMVVSQEGVSLISNYDEEELSLTKRRNFSRSYLFQEHPTVQDLADAIMQDAMLGITNIIARPLTHEDCLDVFVPGEIYRLSHGYHDESMCIKNGDYPEGYLDDYWTYFNEKVLGGVGGEIQNSVLMDYPVEIIYYPDFLFNGSEQAKSIAQLTALLAEEKTKEQTIHTVSLLRTQLLPEKRIIRESEVLLEDGTFLNEDTGEYEYYLPDHETHTFVLELTRTFTPEEQKESYMKHLQIVVGEEEFAGEISPAAQFYLSLLLLNSMQQPLTNKTLNDFSSIRTKLPKTLIASLTAKGYICSVPSIRKGAVLTKVQSMKSIEHSILDSFYHIRIVQRIARDVGRIIEPYIGKVKGLYNKTVVKELIEAYLDVFLSESALLSFDVDLGSSSDYQDTEEIKLNLVFYGEVDEITTTIQMRDEGWAFDLWTLNE